MGHTIRRMYDILHDTDVNDPTAEPCGWTVHTAVKVLRYAISDKEHPTASIHLYILIFPPARPQLRPEYPSTTLLLLSEFLLVLILYSKR